MKRMFLAAAMAAALTAGCQPEVVSKYMPVAVPIRLSPATTLTVVGTGDTAEEARQAAINRLVYEVILPPSESGVQTEHVAEFVESMIRGYNVVSTQKDIIGTYYVTIELSVSQLGLNYQELYHRCGLREDEMEVLKKDVEADEQLRIIAEQRAVTAERQLESEKRLYTKRLMEMQAQLDALKKSGAAPEP
ncbi:MAG: hypothetical protein JXL80_15530 [Planctomycetes bacterium]|nr:hypothetical protein [Planctomycetota bacterium]